jgi:WD40 repeat protein
MEASDESEPSGGRIRVHADLLLLMSVAPATSEEPIRTFSGHNHAVDSLAFTPGGKVLVSGSRDGTVELWNVDTGGLISTLAGHAKAVYSVDVSPDGNRIASGSRDQTVRLWERDGGGLGAVLIGHTDTVFSVAFSPDGKNVASGSLDAKVRLWSAVRER